MLVRSLCRAAILVGCFALAPAAVAQNIVYIYDSLGRLAHVEYGNTTISYNYDANGNRITVVTGANGAPTANPDSATTSAGKVKYDPRFNDTDPDGDPLTITAVTQGANGTVVITGGSTVTYTANSGFHGTDTFTYTISDGHSHTATATDTITVP
jgi:YD repeat-containing protein